MSGDSSAYLSAEVDRLRGLFALVDEAIHNETLTEFSRLVAVSTIKNAALRVPPPEPCPFGTPGAWQYLENLRRLRPSKRTIEAIAAVCTCGQHSVSTEPTP